MTEIKDHFSSKVQCPFMISALLPKTHKNVMDGKGDNDDSIPNQFVIDSHVLTQFISKNDGGLV